MIPQTFEEWRNCIVHECKIALTKEFALQRLSVLQDRTKDETRKFIALYGENHLLNVIEWFQKVGV